MKRCLSYAWSALICCSMALSQEAAITNITSLNLPVEAYYPQFSADDEKLYFTSSHFQGIWEHDLQTSTTRMINDDPGAGYNFQISSDGLFVIFRSDNFDQPKRRSAIIAMNLQNNARLLLQPLDTEISPPCLTDAGNLWFTVSSRLTSLSMATKSLQKITSTDDPVVFIENQKMALYTKSGKKMLDPIPGGSYYWQSISPDHNRILFTEARRGTFVSDLDGTVLISLGKANAPQWSADGRWICYMDDYDNGLYYTASDIYIVSADGRKRYALTGAENKIEMYPSFAKTSTQKIVHTTDTGKITIVEFRTER